MLKVRKATNRSPLFLAQGAATDKAIKADLAAWNKRLVGQAAAWSFANPNSTVSILDTVPIFTEILDHPRQFGAPNATCFAGDGTSCLWWNNYHPGQAIQKAVGSAAYSKLYGAGSLGLIESN